MKFSLKCRKIEYLGMESLCIVYDLGIGFRRGFGKRDVGVWIRGDISVC